MFGWWSIDYLHDHNDIPIHIYTTDNSTNTMVIKILDSNTNPPDHNYNWTCVGKLIKSIKKIDYKDLINMYKKTNMNTDTNSYLSDEYEKNKKRKISVNDITFTNDINYGWYSQEFIDKELNVFSSKPKIHKYLTPINSTVLVTHVTSNLNNKPLFKDTFYVGEVTKYLESMNI